MADIAPLRAVRGIYTAVHMRRTLLPFVAVVFLALILAVWSGKHGRGRSMIRVQSGDQQESETSERSTGDGGVDRHVILTQDPVLRDMSDRESKSAVECLRELEHAAFIACVRRAVGDPVHPSAIADLCKIAGARDPRIIELLVALLPQVPVSRVFEYIDQLFAFFGDDEELQVTIETVIHRLMTNNPEWTKSLGEVVLARDMFAGSRTEGPIIATAMLARENDDLLTALQDGAAGIWGGTGPQIMRAIAATGGLLREYPEDVLEFYYSVYKSTTLPAFPEVGGMLVAQLSFPQYIVDNDSAPNCDLMLAILQDARYRRQAAKQLYSMYGVSAPPWIADKLWSPVLAELRAELGK